MVQTSWTDSLSGISIVVILFVFCFSFKTVFLAGYREKTKARREAFFFIDLFLLFLYIFLRLVIFVFKISVEKCITFTRYRVIRRLQNMKVSSPQAAVMMKVGALQCVERSLLPKRLKFLQQPMSIATMVTWLTSTTTNTVCLGGGAGSVLQLSPRLP